MLLPKMMRRLALAVVLGWFPGPATAQSGTSSATDPLQELEALEVAIDSIESSISEASDQVDILKDTALSGRVGRTYAKVHHRDLMGSGYKLLSIRYRMDGQVLLERDEKAKPPEKVVPLYEGAIEPGAHLFEVEAVVASGTFGVFTYAQGYEFKVESKYTLRVREGRLNRLSIVFHQKPDVTLPPEQRLGVRFDLEVAEGLPLEADGDGSRATR